MSEVLEVEVDRDVNGLLVRAPRVGLWCDPPPVGRRLGPGSDVGMLVQLNRRHRLVLPEGAGGVVGEGVSALRVVAVEYGQLLFRLCAVEGDRVETSTSRAEAGDDIAAGVHAVVSPTDGVFYRRPSPDEEPFVEVGSRVARGQPVGLVEVMKTFNQVVYDGSGVPDEAEVLEIRCGEAEEVRAGQALILLR